MTRHWSESVARDRLNRALETVDARHGAAGANPKRWAELELEAEAAFALEDMDRLADACEKFVEETANGVPLQPQAGGLAGNGRNETARRQGAGRATMAENKAQAKTGVAALFTQTQGG
jgi:hypothetical protein